MKAKIKNGLKIAGGISMVFATLGTLVFGTYAWFTSTSVPNIESESENATLTTAAPDGAEFFYFKGNGIPGADSYTGYSKSGADFGNETNVVDTANSRYSTDEGSNFTGLDSPIIDQDGSDGDSIDPIDSGAWGWIDKGSTSTASGVASPANCFDFSKMRPGCHYSFCLVYSGVSSLTLRLTTGTSGSSLSPKEYVYENGSVTSYPINLAMAMNGYVRAGNASGGPSYINNTVTSGSYTSADKIVWQNSYGSFHDFNLLSGVAVGGNNYIYFTIFMGLPDKSDSLTLSHVSGDNYYYTRGQTGGSYSPYNGLSTSITSLTVA